MHANADLVRKNVCTVQWQNTRKNLKVYSTNRLHYSHMSNGSLYCNYKDQLKGDDIHTVWQLQTGTGGCPESPDGLGPYDYNFGCRS